MAASTRVTIAGYDPVNIQPWAYSVIATTTVLSLGITGLRLLSRRLRKQGLWWDDWLIIFAQIWMFFTVAGFLTMLGLGVGLHIDALGASAAELPETLTIVVLVTNCFYFWNMAVTKVSVLFLYVRIFRFKSYLTRAAWIIGAIVVAWAITITFLTIFNCFPVSKLWDSSVPGHCMSRVLPRAANALMTILTDVIILVLPIPKVWKLQMPIAKKAAVLFAFSLGSFVVFTSTYRIHVVLLQDGSDPSYSIAPSLGWTCIELSASIISASLPTLGPVVGAFLKAVGLKGKFGFSRDKSANGYDNSRGPTSSPKNMVVDLGQPRVNDFYKSPHPPYKSLGREEGPKFYEETSGDALRTRPSHGFQRASMAWATAHVSKESDDIPLRGISVRTEFVHCNLPSTKGPAVPPKVWTEAPFSYR